MATSPSSYSLDHSEASSRFPTTQGTTDVQARRRYLYPTTLISLIDVSVLVSRQPSCIEN
ncbi:hypothetical protein K443DRAFT_685183 [Laccaria amethystina LaAM-08-1]|uniref:Uncharacterized protein n=1 Tax=Laccaria amethystina LaAM-08-1 TaxID=1095629 RepID=A0A0C9X4K2_9AGAR|nr:hypothetical protein K443DRAFT_685183 [Laccaria amethystina LaAM-08-1]